MNKETLLRYQQNRREIIQIEEEILTLRAKLESPKTSSFTGMPSAKGPGDRLADGIAALDTLTSRYEKKLHDLYVEQEAIEKALNYLSGNERTILRYRYLNGYKWETICNLMGSEAYGPMEWTTVHRKHRKALQRLEALTEPQMLEN